MKNNKGFTLIEIIISIAVLSIISAIFLELFIKADVVQKQGKITDDKAFLISNLFETLIAQDTVASFADQTLPQSKQEKKGKHSFDYFYDKSFHQVEEADSYYYLQITFEEKERLNSGSVYQVTASAYCDKEEKPFQMTTHFFEKKEE